MKNKKLVVIAPSVLGPLGKNTNLDHVVINTPVLNQLLNRSPCLAIKQNIQCIEQIELLKASSDDSIANHLAKEANIYKKNHDYLLVDLTSMTVAKDHIRLGVKQIDELKNIQLFITELNNWYVDKPWQFIVAESGQIFLESETAFSISTFPTNYVSGKNISHFMPKSEQENWLHIINEFQMILFQSHHLENKNINNVWLWGEQKAAKIDALFDEESDVLFFKHSEQALLEQDSEKWLLSLEQLDKKIQNEMTNYKEITLVLDYGHIYHYKKSIFSFINKIPFIKKPTLHKWIQLNG